MGLILRATITTLHRRKAASSPKCMTSCNVRIAALVSSSNLKLFGRKVLETIDYDG
jgi:hypothetical protein